MADNLLWLANERYPGRKIVVWAATMHIQPNRHTVDTRKPTLDYTGVEPMGHVAARALGAELFTLGFVAWEGEAGLPWGKRWNIPPAPKGSLVDLCVRAGLENSIVSFRGVGDDLWPRQPLLARPLAHSVMRADWTRVLDGVVFNRVMTPSRMGHSEEELRQNARFTDMLERT